MKNNLDKLFAHPELYMKFWLPFLTEERTQTEIAFVHQLLQGKKWQKLLDIPCGFGRHSVWLAKIWYDVLGIDKSQYFIDRANKDNAAKSVEYKHGDMLDLPYNEEFDYVCNLFSSFGYFDDEGNERTLKNFYNTLKSWGKLVLDVINRDSILESYKAGVRKSFKKVWDAIRLTQESYDPITGCLHNTKTFIVDGISTVVDYDLRIYTYTELRTMLEKVWFSVVSVHGNFDGSPYAITTDRIIILAEK